jgi:chromate reductase
MRQCFIFLGCFALTQPEVLVSFAHEKIDPDGRVTDEKTPEKIRELLASLVAWTTRLLSSRNV